MLESAHSAAFHTHSPTIHSRELRLNRFVVAPRSGPDLGITMAYSSRHASTCGPGTMKILLVKSSALGDCWCRLGKGTAALSCL